MSDPATILGQAIAAGRIAAGYQPRMPIVPFKRVGRVQPRTQAASEEPTDAPASTEAEQPVQEQRRIHTLSDRAHLLVDAVADRAGISLEQFLLDHTVAAASARQIAFALLVRAKLESPIEAASAIGITLGAGQQALRNLDPVLDRQALPVIHDPHSCIEALWQHIEGESLALRCVTVADCIRSASRASGVIARDIMGAGRGVRLAKARHIAMWLARRYSGRSFPEIGRLMGGRDHTTVISGVRRVDRVVGFVEGDESWGLQEWADALWRLDWTQAGRAQ